MSIERSFTAEFLWSLGVRGDQYSDDWQGPAIVSVRDGPPRGSYHVVDVVISVDDALWLVKVEFPPGDWQSNDLNLPEESRAKCNFPGIKVKAVTRTITDYIPVFPEGS